MKCISCMIFFSCEHFLISSAPKVSSKSIYRLDIECSRYSKQVIFLFFFFCSSEIKQTTNVACEKKFAFVVLTMTRSEF